MISMVVSIVSYKNDMSYGITKLHTGLTPDRLGNILAYSHFVHELPGDFIEFGVCTGGSLELLARAHPTKRIYGIDGFEGLPEPTKYDTHEKGEFNLSEKEYLDLVSFFEYNHPNVEIIKGYSPDVFNLIPDDVQYSFCHIDADLFNSVNDALDYLYPRLITGGMMLFDDFSFPSTPGCRKALEQWNEPCKWRGELFFANQIFCGQYLIIK